MKNASEWKALLDWIKQENVKRMELPNVEAESPRVIDGCLDDVYSPAVSLDQSDVQHGFDSGLLTSQTHDIWGYGKEERQRQVSRLSRMVDRYIQLYGDGPVVIVSAPGRAELLGNYQDNLPLGFTLSAAITRDVVAVAGRDEKMFRVHDMKIPDHLERLVKELPSPESCNAHPWHNFAYGVAKQFADLGTGAVRAVIDGEVPLGSGCSSSAAFENALTFAFDRLYDTGLDTGKMAVISKRAENEWQKKGCGFLDQITSLVGGVVFIDYSSQPVPTARQLPGWFDAWSLVTVLADEGHKGEDTSYNTIRPDLEVMRKRIEEVIRLGPEVYHSTAHQDQPVGFETFRRGIFYIDERYRVLEGLACLMSGTPEAARRFGELMDSSGLGSRCLLHNTNLAINEAVELAKENHSYARVHGGGFKGGPIIMTDNPQHIAEVMGAKYGADKVLIHGIRKAGVSEITYEVKKQESVR